MRFSTGVEGEVSFHGDGAKTFSELVVSGRVKESSEGFLLTLAPGEVLTMRIGTLIGEIRQARGRFPRLPLDAQALVFIALAVIAVGIMLASVMAPPELPRMYWFNKKR